MIIFLVIVFVLFMITNDGLCATNSDYYKKQNSNNQNQSQKWKNQEKANMYEYGWDEPEYMKFRNEKDRQSYEREKWTNYEYDYEEDAKEY